jgi:tRNA pseudouridine38-40 synthase
MPRYFLQISYKGTAYHGWQRQPNGITVQETLETALKKIRILQDGITGCGRTDTGVHATEFYAHFDSESPFDESKICFQLNAILPHDIAVQRIIPVKEDAHARFDAEARTYTYRIIHQKDPFWQNLSYLHWNPLNIEAMNEAANHFLGRQEFTSFTKMNGPQKTDYCDVSISNWETSDNQSIFTIRADRFLRNMVRAIVGTLLEVGTSKMDPDQVKEIITMKDRSKAGSSAPAHGLYLSRIDYPYIDPHVS